MWSIVLKERTERQFFFIFEHGAEYGAESGAECGAK